MERERITREELMERLFHDDYENLKGKKLRMTRVSLNPHFCASGARDNL